MQHYLDLFLIRRQKIVAHPPVLLIMQYIIKEIRFKDALRILLLFVPFVFHCVFSKI